MNAARRARIVATARSWLGTPYHHQASLRGVGCDCLGLVRGVWRELYGDEPCTLQCFGTEEIGGVIIRFQNFDLFRGYYGGELLQISDHQQLHTSEWFVVLPEFSHDMVNGI